MVRSCVLCYVDMADSGHDVLSTGVITRQFPAQISDPPPPPPPSPPNPFTSRNILLLTLLSLPVPIHIYVGVKETFNAHLFMTQPGAKKVFISNVLT